MKITIKPINIIEDPANQVTSEKIFQRRTIKNGDRYLFDEEGIFSEKIFGKFGRCYCGKLTKPGYCKECGCRVISKRNVPNFFIKFNFDLPNRIIDYGDMDKEIFGNLMNYKGFLYDSEYIEYDLNNINTKDYPDEDKLLIGKEAVLSLGANEAWYDKNVHRTISIPHTSFRQVTFQNENYFLGPLNTSYINIIKQSQRFDKKQTKEIFPKLDELNIKFMVVRELEKINNELFQILAKNKSKNVISNELKGQPETGMIRAVMTNNFGLDEDTLKIGYYFIPTLYPKLFNDFTDETTGQTDIESLNKYLEDNEYLVLFNRQPTIGAKSIIAMKPVFSALEQEQFVIQANPIVYDGLAADVDGDSLNVIALYSKEACEEAKKLLASKNYIEGSNSSIRNAILEEFAYVDTLLED